MSTLLFIVKSNRNRELFIKYFASIHDEFDVETGKRIARRRAMELYQKSLWKHISNIYDSMTAAMVEMEDKIFF